MVKISIEDFRRVYNALDSAYDVKKMEVGEDTETEDLLQMMKNKLIAYDQTFTEDNSLYHFATQPWHGQPILVVLKNEERCPVEDLKKVHFPIAQGGFSSHRLSYMAYEVGEDTYVVFWSESFDIALEEAKSLRDGAFSDELAEYYGKLVRDLEQWKQEAA